MNTSRRSWASLFVLSILFGLSAGCSTSAPSPSEPNSDPAAADNSAVEDLARRALRAIQEEDSQALLALAAEEAQRYAEKAPDEAESRMRMAYSQWRSPNGMNIQNWDGKFHGVRYFHRVGTKIDQYEADVKFAELGPEEIAVVNLVWEQDGWRFADLHSPTPERWEKGKTTFERTNEPYGYD